MDFVVKERTYREIKKEYEKLAKHAYPYQQPEMLEASYNSLMFRIKTRAKIRFFAVYQGDHAVLIAPLKVFKSGIKVLGTQEGYNMSDFVYSTKDCNLLADAIFALLNHIKKRIYSDEPFTVDWWYLSDEALSWKALHKLSDDGKIAFSFEPEPINNVQIPLKSDYDTYYNGLSKHARQNIRTAYNRVKRDNCSLSIHFYPMNEGREVRSAAREAYKQYSSIYMKRLEERYHLKGLRLLRKRILEKYINSGWKTASASFTLLADISLNDEVAAYAKCYMDQPHRKVTVPNLAIDIKWGFYSPGIILVNELVNHFIDTGGADYLSMGRGEESYKYEMGGEVYLTYNCSFSLLNEK